MIEDLDALVRVVDGVNVKLAKCGGVGPAKRMLERAKALGFRTFLGCMEETSVGIAASAAVASLAEWVDLDGCLLIADDLTGDLIDNNVTTTPLTEQALYTPALQAVTPAACAIATTSFVTPTLYS